VKYFLVNQRGGREEVHLLQDLGKCLVIERYDAVSEEWIRELVNAVNVITDVSDLFPGKH
jgi:hypothetical protein